MQSQEPFAPVGFFDAFNRFYETSLTGSFTNRLNSRHRVLVDEHLPYIRNKAVLDLGCHDGRWSFAAHKAGAHHVIGVEARTHLVRAARMNMQTYGISESRVRILESDLFDVLPQLQPGVIDTVFCLGFFYHTLYHMQLIHLLTRLHVQYILMDTAVVKSSIALIRLYPERTDVEGNAFSAREKEMLVGTPSRKALAMMLAQGGYSSAFYNWHNGMQKSWKGLRDYERGCRVSLLATKVGTGHDEVGVVDRSLADYFREDKE
jgi:hypothetical protein